MDEDGELLCSLTDYLTEEFHNLMEELEIYLEIFEF